MIVIESPDALAGRLAEDIEVERIIDDTDGVFADVIRERDGQIAAALRALAASWKHDAPATSGGYVAGLEKVVGMLGGTGR